ncbi:MAG: hypothetical protein JNM17_25355 [Archangium sp.]|nr:hypothetical protein [Archangium sp.]
MLKPIFIAALALLSSCASTQAVIRQPDNVFAWKDYWLAHYDHELSAAREAVTREAAVRPVAAARGAGRVVVLVPGISIGREMFAPMAARLERDGFRVVIWEDPALISTGIARAANDLARFVARVRAENGGRRVDLVAECTGGVAARFYLQELDGAASVEHLVTFVSPHHGTVPALIAAGVTSWQGLEDLERGSAFMQVVNARPLPKQTQVTSIYSCDDALLMPRDTAALEGARNVELCGGPRAYGHFDGFWDATIYGHIVESLQASGAVGTESAQR